MGKLQAATDTFKELACYYVGLILLCSTIFVYAEGVAFTDAIYWAVTTSTSTGYGDISPKTLLGKIDAALLMLTSIFFIAPLVVVRLIQNIDVNRHEFSHEEQEQMNQDIADIKAALEIKK